MRLNDIGNVDCREGDRFDPVTDDTFDLIVTNPPFVISPQSAYLFRDSGLPVDEICRSIVQEAPRYLREGGFCQVLASWAHLRGEPWRERLAGWVEESGCDAWVISREVLDPASYASTWLRHGAHGAGDDQVAAGFDAWMDFYEQEGIEAMSLGLITLRKRSGATNWFRAEDAWQEFAAPYGDAIADWFAAHDFLESTDDETLLGRTLSVADDVRLEAVSWVDDDEWVSDQFTLRRQTGLRWAGTIDDVGAQLVAGCNGQQSVRELLTDIEVAEGLPIVRRLIEQGFLRP